MCSLKAFIQIAINYMLESGLLQAVLPYIRTKQLGGLQIKENYA